MGTRGPVPERRGLVLLRGNPAKRRVPDEITPTIAEQPPPAPEWLNEEARRAWDGVAPEMHRLGLLTTLDYALLAAYATAVSRWRQAEGELTGRSLTDKDARALARVANRERDAVARYARQLGLSDTGRLRLAASRITRSKFDGLLA
jgi:P27 family predicted phage terminase small subunit